MVATDRLGLRVIELADRRNQYCGKLFSDFGAEVIQLEPLAGASARGVAPFVSDLDEAEHSLDYWYYNTGKKSIAIDLGTAEGRQIAAELIAGADIFLESGFSDANAWVILGRVFGATVVRIFALAVFRLRNSQQWEARGNFEIYLQVELG